MKKWIVFILAALLIACCELATADSESLWVFKKAGKNSVCITGYAGENEPVSLTIPETIRGKTVTAIGNHAFSAYSNKTGKLESIIIPDTVTSIGDYAFWNCASLISVTLPDSVTSIGSSAFSDCSSLEEIRIPDSVTVIGDSTFSGCMALKEVSIPGTVTSIGNYAFSACLSLLSVKLPGSLTFIGDRAFSNCAVLSEIILPDSLTSIGDKAFESCISLTSVILPASVRKIGVNPFEACPLEAIEISQDNPSFQVVDGVLFSKKGKKLIAYPDRKPEESYAVPDGTKEIGDYAFAECDIVAHISLPDSVKSIGKSAFYICGHLTDINIPRTIKEISESAFCNCYRLASVSLPDSVKTIRYSAFANCSFLTSVFIPASVRTIEESAFSGSGLLDIQVAPKNASYKSVDGVLFTRSGKKLIVYPANRPQQSYAIPEGTKEVERYAFSGAGNLEEITIPRSMKLIGDAAFYNAGLKEAVIPDSVTSLGFEAFGSCRSLEKITIPDSVKTIGNNAFYDCDSLIGVTLPGSVKTIGYDAFANCNPNLVLTVERGSAAEQYAKANWITCRDTSGELIFGSQDALEALAKTEEEPENKEPEEMPDFSVMSAGDTFTYQDWTCCFLYDGTLEIIEYSGQETILKIPDIFCEKTVTAIGNDAFAADDNLNRITIPASVTRLMGNPFTRCRRLNLIEVSADNPSFLSLNGVLFTKDMKTIAAFPPGARQAVYDIPDGTQTIGDLAFCNCGKLEQVNIPDSVTSIGTEAFSYCSVLKRVSIPDSVTAIGDRAFVYSDLSEIIIPASVISVGVNPFSGCSAAAIQVSPENASVKTEDGVLFTKDGQRLIAFPRMDPRTSYDIPEGTLEIGEGAFFYCTNLTRISFPDSVTAIGSEAFYECQSLTAVTIPVSVASIGEFAFGCYRKEDQNLVITAEPGSCAAQYAKQHSITCQDAAGTPSGADTSASVEQPGSETQDISNLKVKDIIDSGDWQCWILDDGTAGIAGYYGHDSSIIIPDKLEGYTVTYVEAGVFSSAASLTIPASVTQLGGNPSTGGSLSSIEIAPDSTSFRMADGVLFTSDMKTLVAFPAADLRTSYDIPEGTEIIAKGAFETCISLMQVTVPASVTSIGSEAFSDCAALTAMTVPASVTCLDDDIFYVRRRDLVLTVEHGSAIEQYAQNSGIECQYEN